MSKSTQKNKSLPTPLIIVALDFGGSATKVIYVKLSGSPYSLYMEPEVAWVPVESINSYAKNNSWNTLGATDPENVAWVSVAGSTMAVGYLAASRYYANAALKELKYERGLFKTLAAVWVIKEKLKLPLQFRVAIAILLPPGEFENKKRFETLLKEALANYMTPTGLLNVELVMFKCLPEGAGVYMAHQKKVGESLKRRVCAIVMLGYRNTSLLISNRGAVESGKTSPLGFVRMVEKVVGVTSGQTLERLTPAIAAAGVEPDSRVLQKLVRSKTRENRTSEVQTLIAAIKLARLEYAATLTSWLDNALPDSADEIVFCGGTADYLMKELNDHYLGTQLSWNASVAIPAALDTHSLGSRLCDVYTLFLYYHGLVEKQFGLSSEREKEAASREV